MLGTLTGGGVIKNSTEIIMVYQTMFKLYTQRKIKIIERIYKTKL